MGDRLFLNSGFFLRCLDLFVGYSASCDKKPVGIDPGGGAGYQGTQILPGGNTQQGCLVRENRVDLHYLIGKGLYRNIQVEHISHGKLLQIREHLLSCHAGVPGNDTVGIFSAHRQR